MMLLLATVRKSGTNFFRIALFNYLSILKGDRDLKTYDDLTAAFPNTLSNYQNDSQETAQKGFLPDGTNDFVYGHNPALMRKMLNGPMVCIARNPLDQIVSAFHYQLRAVAESEKPSQRGTLLSNLPVQFASSWASVQTAVEQGALLIQYEDLFEQPDTHLADAITHYGLPIEREAIGLACEHASLKNAKKFETENGFMHIGANPAKRAGHWKDKRFVRSGAIGQWKDFYTEDELSAVKTRLIESGVDLDAFRYEPMQALLPNDH